jgi:hypothetical protein
MVFRRSSFVQGFGDKRVCSQVGANFKLASLQVLLMDVGATSSELQPSLKTRFGHSNLWKTSCRSGIFFIYGLRDRQEPVVGAEHYH